jgi:hypothetical protein
MNRSMACFGALVLTSACVVHETRDPGPAPTPAPPSPATVTPPTPVAPPTAPPAGMVLYQHHDVPLVTGNAMFGGPSGPIRGWVFFIQQTNNFPDLAGKIPNAALATGGFNVGSQQPTGGFPGIDPNRNSWFAIRYEGPFVVSTAGTWAFSVTSDDGANLYVDGNIVVQDDGLHPGTTKNGQLNLNAGRHELRMDYFQGGGNVALQVMVTPPNAPPKPFAERM